MKFRRILGSVAGMMLVCACAAGVKIDTVLIEGVDLAARNSFAWDDRATPPADESAARLQQEIGSGVRSAVTESLRRKGYQEAMIESADFLVAYQTVLTDAHLVEGRDPDRVLGSETGVGPGDPLKVFREQGSVNTDVTEATGALMVFATDRATGRILWRGTAEGLLTTPGQAVRRIPQSVSRMFEEFPARRSTP